MVIFFVLCQALDRHNFIKFYPFNKIVQQNKNMCSRMHILEYYLYNLRLWFVIIILYWIDWQMQTNV